jgi:hypothetical protein
MTTHLMQYTASQLRWTDTGDGWDVYAVREGE